MKKFIAIALMLAMCLGLFAACVQEATPTEPVETKNPLVSAAAYLKTMYKDKSGKVFRDFEVVAAVVIDDTKYDIEWTTDAAEENVKIVAGENGKVTIDINEKPAEQVDFTLTATIKDAAGNSEKTTLSYYIEAVKPTGTTTATMVTAPEAGTAYKLGMFQGNLGQTLYFAGTVANKDYYMATTEDLNAATDVTLEAVDGGYKLYFMAEGTKTYLDVYKSGDFVNLRLTTEPTAVWTWNTEFNTLVADVEGTTYYCGTYKEYNTLSASDIKYAATSFPSNLFSVGTKEVKVEAVKTPAAETAYKIGMLQGNLGKTLYFAGTTANKDYYMTTTEDIGEAVDVKLEAVDGGYKLYFMAEGVKTYLDVYKNGDYVNLRLTTEPTAVWTWNTEYNTLVADVEGTTYYCGTYNEYTTLSASDFKYASTSFPSNLYTVG